MFVKFESKRAASFIMQGHIAEHLLALMGHSGKLEGSISGAAVEEAIANLDRALAEDANTEAEAIDDDEEQELVSLSARTAPLRELLQHAKRSNTYLIWRPE